MITKHGTTNGYKVHACRCVLCSRAMSAYQKARAVLARDCYTVSDGRPALSASRSWWIGTKPQGFTSLALAEHPRMALSKFGEGIHKPIDSDELRR